MNNETQLSTQLSKWIELSDIASYVKLRKNAIKLTY